MRKTIKFLVTRNVCGKLKGNEIQLKMKLPESETESCEIKRKTRKYIYRK